MADPLTAQPAATRRSVTADIVRRHWTGLPEWRLQAAAQGTNPWCVDCGRTPLDGGLRCYPCFAAVARPHRARTGRALPGDDAA